MKGDGVHLEEAEGGLPEEDDIVTGVCERCVKGIVSQFKYDEKRAHTLQGRNKRGCERSRLFIAIATWAGLGLAKNRDSKYRYKCSNQQ